MKTTEKYAPKGATVIAYRLLLCVGILLTVGRWYSVIDSDFVLINDVIHTHITNFSLSMLLYLGVGYAWLTNGMKFRYIVILGAFLIIANLICETLMGFMNTPDIMDAVYGAVGVGVAFVFLLFTHKYGLLPQNEDEAD